MYLTVHLFYNPIYGSLNQSHRSYATYIIILLVIRSSLPRLELDEAFASKGEIANAVKNQLSTLMTEYGYEILVALVTDLNPDQTVKNAMNEINGNPRIRMLLRNPCSYVYMCRTTASQRLREAAKEKAEAEKILQVCVAS